MDLTPPTHQIRQGANGWKAVIHSYIYLIHIYLPSCIVSFLLHICVPSTRCVPTETCMEHHRSISMDTKKIQTHRVEIIPLNKESDSIISPLAPCYRSRTPFTHYLSPSPLPDISTPLPNIFLSSKCLNALFSSVRPSPNLAC